MTGKAEFFAILGASLTVVGLICAYLLPAWKERRKAESAERQLVALVASDRVQRGIHVLVGSDADPAQGIEETPGLGKRVARIEKLLNGGGLGSQMAALSDKVTEHIDEANTNRDQIVDDLRETRADLGKAVIVLTNNQQRFEEKVEDLGEKVNALDEKVNGQLVDLEEQRAHLTAALQAAMETPHKPEA